VVFFVDNCKPARLPLGGHRELFTIEETACRHISPTTYTMVQCSQQMMLTLDEVTGVSSLQMLSKLDDEDDDNDE